MSLLESLRLAMAGLRSNKMRAILTMLGIIIGISAVIGILTVGDGLSGSITGAMSSLGASSITVSLQQKESATGDGMGAMMGRGKAPTEEDLITEKMIDGMVKRYGDQIHAVSLSESAGSGRAHDGRLYANLSATGVNIGYFTANELDLLGGRILREKDISEERMVCLVSDKLVGNMFKGNTDTALGNELVVDLNGETYRFRIVGIYEYEASAFSISLASDKDISTSLYIPLTTAKRITGNPDGFSNFTVQANDDVDGALLAQDLARFLNRYYSKNENYSIMAMSMESIIETMGDVMDKLSIAISVIAAISLLVGGIGVMNIMLVSVTERTREIGTRKALGATNGNIRLQFVVESALICLVGGAIGILLGAILGYVGSSLLDAPALPSLGSITLAVGFSLAVGIFFGYYPANKAAKMDPIEALRYE